MNEKNTGVLRFQLDPQSLPRLSERNHEKLRTLADEEVDLTDIPRQTSRTWTRPGAVSFSMQPEEVVTIQIDRDVLEYFRKADKPDQETINVALRDYMNSHKHAL